MNKKNLEDFLLQFLQDRGVIVKSSNAISREVKPVSKVIVKDMVHEMLSVFTQVLAVGGRINLPEIGYLETREVKERINRNPKTGEKVVTPAHKKVVFKASSQIKEAVNLKK